MQKYMTQQKFYFNKVTFLVNRGEFKDLLPLLRKVFCKSNREIYTLHYKVVSIIVFSISSIKKKIKNLEVFMNKKKECR
jgi:hypothetical protein